MSDHDAQLANYLAGKPVAIDETLRTLPRTANLANAVEVVLRLLGEPQWLVACGKLPARLIRGVVEAPATTASHLFLKLAVPEGKRWVEAVRALRDLADARHALDTEERRAQLAAIAGKPHLLQAIQGVAANTPNVPVEMLVVLALDGSDASIDALVPHLDGALGSQDARLERLAMVRPFVKSTPALAAVFAELDGAVDARRSTSPALAFARSIGVPASDVFWCSFLVRSAAGGVPEFQGSVRFDSREERWFAVELTHLHAHDRARDRTTKFDTLEVVDELAIGRCEPSELPGWLRATAAAINVSWDRFYLRTNVDPKPIDHWLITG